MGLGKTMQAITAIRMLLLSGEMQNALLICPKPLVTNWVREFRQWAPEIPVAVIEGDSNKRAWVWSNPQAPVKIANYELMLRDWSIIDSESLHFDLVVLDEAQRIKNRASTTSEVICSIPRTRSWALTGTPIENSIEDLVSIFEFLAPGYLRDDMHLKSLSQATRDYILRRTKDKVLSDMPPKLFRNADLDLSPEQRASYRVAEEEGIVHLSELGESITVQHVFELVLRLKQICNFDPVSGCSTKMERLEADLEEVAASGQKAIVFSQWVETLETIAERLERFHPVQYHGRIPSNKAGWCHRTLSIRSSVQCDPDELRRGGGRFESPVLPLRVLVRPLVESRRRGSSHQPSPPLGSSKAGHGHTHDGGRNHRATDRRSPRAKASAAANLVRRNRHPRKPGAQSSRNLWSLWTLDPQAS
jgi:SNF2 family DNA or RNA helicase